MSVLAQASIIAWWICCIAWSPPSGLSALAQIFRSFLPDLITVRAVIVRAALEKKKLTWIKVAANDRSHRMPLTCPRCLHCRCSLPSLPAAAWIEKGLGHCAWHSEHEVHSTHLKVASESDMARCFRDVIDPRKEQTSNFMACASSVREPCAS